MSRRKAKLCYGKAVSTKWERAPEHGLGYWEISEGKIPTGIKRRKLKCSVCKRKVWSSIKLCDDGCCIVHYIPQHKPKYWWRKGKRKRRK
jgi:hypothetical protein